ncbi:hypothetical protein [Laspinema palackyanum]
MNRQTPPSNLRANRAASGLFASLTGFEGNGDRRLWTDPFPRRL